MLQTIRVPTGPGDVGKIYALAINPRGNFVAAGGYMRTTEEQAFAIYLFDLTTGEMREWISDDLPEVTNQLAFSVDGRYLGAMLGNGQGLRVYNRDNKWSEVFRDTKYAGDSYGAAFANDGRLATASSDGVVRLYDRNFRPIGAKRATGGQYPGRVVFHPNGKVLAIGFIDVPAVELLDANSLADIPGPNTNDLRYSLDEVAWSPDGQTLFASGGGGPRLFNALYMKRSEDKASKPPRVMR